MMYHDCVVVPGWGALIANYRPSAVYNGIIHRPFRTIAFNAAITHNDGLLATSLMRRHGMSYNQACDFISNTLTTFDHHLKTGAELAFGHLGYFKLGAQQQLEFNPMQRHVMSDENYGLTDFNVASLSQDDANDAGFIAPVTVTLRERLKVAASIAAIVGVGLLLSTPVIIDKSMQTASLNVAEVKKPATPQVTIKPANESTNRDKKFAVIDENGKETPVTSHSKAKESTLERKSIDENMALYSCHSERKAKKMARRYSRKGVETAIVEHDGKYLLLSLTLNDSNHNKKASHREKSKHRQ